MAIINKVLFTTTYTRSDLSFPWHEETLLDQELAALQQEVIAMSWANYTSKKIPERKVVDDGKTLIVRFTWFRESDFNEWYAMENVQKYRADLKAYYEANGGTMTQNIEVLVNDFLSTP